MLQINEIFYSLQGEGARVGTPNVFIRLQGCKVKFACMEYGVDCDTEFESGTAMSLEQIAETIAQYPCKNIIWTGGEPAQQLTEEIVSYFKEKGYFQAIETSGAYKIPNNLDYVALSPKVAEHVLQKNFKEVDELRYVIHIGKSLPTPTLKAKRYFLSPHANGIRIDEANLQHCVDLCLQNPQWSLSLQTHKLINIL